MEKVLLWANIVVWGAVFFAGWGHEWAMLLALGVILVAHCRLATLEARP